MASLPLKLPLESSDSRMADGESDGPGSPTTRKWSVRTIARVPETTEESGDESTRGSVPIGASFCVKQGFSEEPGDREWLAIGRGADVVFSVDCERTTHDFWSIRFRFKRIKNYRSPCAHGRPVRRAGDHVHDLFD